MKKRMSAAEFEREWNTSESLAHFLRKTKAKRFSSTAVALRAKGVPLRLFGKGGMPAPDFKAIIAEAKKHRPIPPDSLRRDPFRFVRIWQTSRSVKEVCRRMKMSRTGSALYAHRLRLRGVPLKSFRDGPKAYNSLLGELTRYSQGHGTPSWIIISGQRRQIKKLEAEILRLKK